MQSAQRNSGSRGADLGSASLPYGEAILAATQLTNFAAVDEIEQTFRLSRYSCDFAKENARTRTA
jgi:hypothetical protein